MFIAVRSTETRPNKTGELPIQGGAFAVVIGGLHLQGGAGLHLRVNGEGWEAGNNAEDARAGGGLRSRRQRLKVTSGGRVESRRCGQPGG